MKRLTVLITAVGIAIAVPAFAENNYGSSGATNNDNFPSTSTAGYASGVGGKTRAEVYAELVQAQKDGFLPFKKTDYPPSAETIRRNQELYRLTH